MAQDRRGDRTEDSTPVSPLNYPRTQRPGLPLPYHDLAFSEAPPPGGLNYSSTPAGYVSPQSATSPYAESTAGRQANISTVPTYDQPPASFTSSTAYDPGSYDNGFKDDGPPTSYSRQPQAMEFGYKDHLARHAAAQSMRSNRSRRSKFDSLLPPSPTVCQVNFVR
jgi:hypothetical protein